MLRIVQLIIVLTGVIYTIITPILVKVLQEV